MRLCLSVLGVLMWLFHDWIHSLNRHTNMLLQMLTVETYLVSPPKAIDMSQPEMVRLDDEAAHLLTEMVDGLPGNPELKSLTSEAVKQYYEETYLPMMGGETVTFH